MEMKRSEQALFVRCAVEAVGLWPARAVTAEERRFVIAEITRLLKTLGPEALVALWLVGRLWGVPAESKI